MYMLLNKKGCQLQDSFCISCSFLILSNKRHIITLNESNIEVRKLFKNFFKEFSHLILMLNKNMSKLMLPHYLTMLYIMNGRVSILITHYSQTRL